MKEFYVTPTMQVQTITVAQLICGSGTSIKIGDPVPADEAKPIIV